MAGAISILFSNRGTIEPINPAMKRFMIIESPMTIPNIPLSNQREAIIPMIIAKTRPFVRERITSFLMVLP